MEMSLLLLRESKGKQRKGSGLPRRREFWRSFATGLFPIIHVTATDRAADPTVASGKDRTT
jgi:hypothetical protein